MELLEMNKKMEGLEDKFKMQEIRIALLEEELLITQTQLVSTEEQLRQVKVIA